MNDNSQLICQSEPFCLCVGDVSEWDECDCFAGADKRCVSCGAEMLRIDLDTGEAVAA